MENNQNNQEKQESTQNVQNGRTLELRKKESVFKKYLTVKFIATSGIVAALYVALTLLFAPISFREIQFRVSEVLTLLPVVSLPAVPGVFVGCLIANLLAGAPFLDILLGSLATLAAAVLTRFFRRFAWLAAFMPVLLNGLVIGFVIVHVYKVPMNYWAAAGSVAIGEAAVCYMFGLPLVTLLKKRIRQEVLEAR